MPTNCYIVRKTDCRDALLIDPGDDDLVIKKVASEMGASIKAILLTHGHFDHILAVGDMRQVAKPVAIHKDDAHSLTERDMFSPLVAYDGRPFEKAEIIFETEGSYSIGGFDVEVLFTPGHTDGSVCYVMGDSMFTGDTLFKGSVGTLDYGGNLQKQRTSLARLATLAKDYTLYPGHGEVTTLSYEKQTNPFIRNFAL